MEILDWLKKDEHPQDLYDLLCTKRFDPDTAGLRKAISQVSRDLLPYQGHADPEVARNAMKLLTDLGGADMILGSDEKLRDHNCHVAENLLDEYLEQSGIDIDDVQRKQFATWMVNNADVHPDAVKTAVQDWLKESLPAPAPKATAAQKGAPKKAVTRKPRPKRRKRRQDLDDLFDDLGVTRGRDRHPSRRGRTGSRSSSGRSGRGRKKKQSMPMWIPIAGGAGALLVIVIFAMAIFGGGDKSGKVTVIVDPKDAVVTTDFEGAKVESNGDQHVITVEDAEAAKDGIQVSVNQDGFLTGGFRWVPQPGQETDEPVNVKLIVDFEARKQKEVENAN